MSEWQPIETAPKDGTRVLIAWNNGCDKGVVSAYWEPGYFGNIGWTEFQLRSDYWGPDTPTHWMPLPKPPK